MACLIASRHPIARERRVWTVLALINCLFLGEILIGFRHRIHNLADSILMAVGKYDDRGPLQEILIFSIVAVSCALAALALFRLRFYAVGTRLATGISLAVLALFVIEGISLHALDAVFYRAVGTVLLIGWIWVGACAITIIATFWR